MLNLIKTEIKRNFTGRWFWLSVIISGTLVIWYSIDRIPFCIQSNLMILENSYPDDFLEISFTNWIGSHNIYLQQNIFYLILPFLATIPFGKSFYEDLNQGLIKNICIRTPKKNYLISKYIVVFLSGGCAVVIPMIFSFMISSAFLPTMLPEVSYVYTNIFPIYKWSDLFFENPFVYTILYGITVFIFSGFFACMSLPITYFSSKSFLPILFPFIIYIVSSMFFELFDMPGFSLRQILTTTGEQGTTMTVVLLAISLGVFSFIPYYFIGVNNDVV